MRLYVIQIHNSNGDEPDDILIFKEFENLRGEFKRKFEHYKKISEEVLFTEEPTLDESTNEASGYFSVENCDGSVTEAIVSDYMTFDD